jgi:hypothetical protein
LGLGLGLHGSGGAFCAPFYNGPYDQPTGRNRV